MVIQSLLLRRSPPLLGKGRCSGHGGACGRPPKLSWPLAVVRSEVAWWSHPGPDPGDLGPDPGGPLESRRPKRTVYDHDHHPFPFQKRRTSQVTKIRTRMRPPSNVGNEQRPGAMRASEVFHKPRFLLVFSGLSRTAATMKTKRLQEKATKVESAMINFYVVRLHSETRVPQLAQPGVTPAEANTEARI